MRLSPDQVPDPSQSRRQQSNPCFCVCPAVRNCTISLMRCAGLAVLIDGPDYSALSWGLSRPHSNIQHFVRRPRPLPKICLLPWILSVQSKSQNTFISPPLRLPLMCRLRRCMCKITQFQMHFGALGRCCRSRRSGWPKFAYLRRVLAASLAGGCQASRSCGPNRVKYEHEACDTHT